MKKLLSTILIAAMSVGFLSSASCFAVEPMSTILKVNQSITENISSVKETENLISDIKKGGWDTFKSITKTGAGVGAAIGSVTGAFAGLYVVTLQYYFNSTNLTFLSGLIGVSSGVVMGSATTSIVATVLTAIPAAIIGAVRAVI